MRLESNQRAENMNLHFFGGFFMLMRHMKTKCCTRSVWFDPVHIHIQGDGSVFGYKCFYSLIV